MLKNSVNLYAGGGGCSGAVVAQRLSRVGELLVLCRLARRPAFRALLAGAGIAVCGALLSACNLTAGGESGTAPPDAVDRIRQTDLQPRFTAPSEAANTGAAGGPRATSYYGSRPVEAAA